MENLPSRKIFAWSNYTVQSAAILLLQPVIQELNGQLIEQESNKNEDKNTSQKQLAIFTLQIRQNSIAVRQHGENSKKQIIDFFDCCPDIGFEFIKVNPTSETVQSKIGYSIKFGLGYSLTSSTSFSILETSSDLIAQFQKELCRKYLIQPHFHQLYKPIRLIGQGVTAVVFSTMNLKTKQMFASKSFSKSKYFKSANNTGKLSYYKQFKILTQLKQRNLSKLFGVFQTQNSIYLIMQLMQRSLMGLIVQNQPMPIQMIITVIYGLLDGVNFLHSAGIMHRDIKLENIMVRVSNLMEVEPVLIDFGLADYFKHPPYLYPQCGTPGYISPESFTNNPIPHPERCDIFALGVVLHVMMFKKGIFRSDQASVVLQKNRKGQLEICEGGPPDLRELLLKMLQKDNTKRISAAEALQNPIFFKLRQIQVDSTQKMPQPINTKSGTTLQQ